MIEEIAREIIGEFLIKGPGYLIVKLFGGSEADPDGCLVFIVGVAFWCAIFFGLWTIFG